MRPSHRPPLVRVVFQEAGGKVTDTRGEPLDFSLGAKLPREVGAARRLADLSFSADYPSL